MSIDPRRNRLCSECQRAIAGVSGRLVAYLRVQDGRKGELRGDG
ncbi:MAG TPA: hypothetical protein VD932_02670 [Aquabacterium sp.]|nr:hypothetical protein [Aquabacterium sp.]